MIKYIIFFVSLIGCGNNGKGESVRVLKFTSEVNGEQTTIISEIPDGFVGRSCTCVESYSQDFLNEKACDPIKYKCRFGSDGHYFSQMSMNYGDILQNKDTKKWMLGIQCPSYTGDDKYSGKIKVKASCLFFY